MALDGFDDGAELRESALFDGEADQRALLVVAMAQRMQQRQRGFAFGEIVAEVLAARRRIRLVIEHVIDELVGGAEMFAVSARAPTCCAVPAPASTAATSAPASNSRPVLR